MRDRGLCLRSPAALAAEHLFLRTQLALYQARDVQPKRVPPCHTSHAGLARPLVQLATSLDHRPAPDLDPLAPPGVSPVLAMEVSFRATATFDKRRHHGVDLRADVSRPSRCLVTPHRRRRARFPDGRLVPARGRVGAGAAGLDDTRARACRTAVTGMWTGAERAHMGGHAPGADTPGACGVLA
jgi:hypothetical protein